MMHKQEGMLRLKEQRSTNKHVQEKIPKSQQALIHYEQKRPPIVSCQLYVSFTTDGVLFFFFRARTKPKNF